MRHFLIAIAALTCVTESVTASVLFDFDGAPVHSSLPLDQTAEGITAHLSATGQGFSIQPWGTLGIAPAGMGGNYIYPNSVFRADLLVKFDTPLSDFSILYAPDELATESSCTMRVTAYNGPSLIGTSTYQIPPGLAGTYPTGTLSISTAVPFDNVVVHYESPPPTGGDYGVIFFADNMTVTAFVPEPAVLGMMTFAGWLVVRRR